MSRATAEGSRWASASQSKELVDRSPTSRTTTPGASIGRPSAHEQTGAGVDDLVTGLGRRERRIDGGQRRADPPRREHGDDQLDPVGQHHGHHVARPDTERAEVGGDGPYPAGELGVRQLEAVVVDARRVRRDPGPFVGQGAEVEDGTSRRSHGTNVRRLRRRGFGGGDELRRSSCAPVDKRVDGLCGRDKARAQGWGGTDIPAGGAHL